MPYDPEIDEEVVDAAPIAIAPPATVAQQAQVPAYANDVYEGPRSFKTFTGYQAAWDRARDEAMAQRAEDARFKEILSNATAVEDQLKAIQQAKQFVQMRKFGSDLQAGIASGLTPEQALAPALARNPSVLLGNMSSSVSAFRNAGRSMQPQVPFGSTTIVYDPETKKRIGLMIRQGDGSSTFRPDFEEKKFTTKIPQEMIDATPKGYKPVSDGRGGVRYLKTETSAYEKYKGNQGGQPIDYREQARITAEENRKKQQATDPLDQTYIPVAQPTQVDKSEQVKVPAGYVAVVNTKTGEKKMVKESNASKISSDSPWKLVK